MRWFRKGYNGGLFFAWYPVWLQDERCYAWLENVKIYRVSALRRHYYSKEAPL